MLCTFISSMRLHTHTLSQSYLSCSFPYKVDGNYLTRWEMHFLHTTPEHTFSAVSDYYLFFSTHLQSPKFWLLQIALSSFEESFPLPYSPHPPVTFTSCHWCLVLEMPWANYIPSLRPALKGNLPTILWKPFSQVICSFLVFLLQHAVGTHHDTS